MAEGYKTHRRNIQIWRGGEDFRPIKRRTETCCRFVCCWAFSWVLFYSQYNVKRGFAVHLVNVWPPQSALHSHSVLLYWTFAGKVFFFWLYILFYLCSCSMIIIIVIFWLINGNVLFMLEIPCLCFVPYCECQLVDATDLFPVRMFHTHTNLSRHKDHFVEL